MNVSLTPELERYITEKVGTGLYQTSSEVVREALRLLRQRDEALRREVQQGIADLAAGRFDEYDESSLAQLADGVKARSRVRRRSKGPVRG